MVKTFEEAAHIVAKEIAELVISKQRDYGHSNILAFGELGVLIRANDKIARLRNLIMNDRKPDNEAKIDSWSDLSGYGIIALMLDRGWFELELGGK